MKKIFENKIILITGGCGSIGSEIVKQLLTFNPKQVRIFDNRETELFNMQHELINHKNLRFLVGDIRDKDRIALAMENVDFVFHSAALKHVPSCEYNPFEAVKTNVNGTQNVVDAALANSVSKVINISTDKVTNTISTMGATKLLAERLVNSAHYYKGNKKTLFASVRFGNVLGSRGSVIELFKNQIKNKIPLTLTDNNMTRFIMSIPQAVNLVLKTAEQMQGGEIFILKMPVFRLKDLVDIMIERYAPKNNISIKKIGLRPGEKMYESLMTEEEAASALEIKDSFIVLSEIIIPNFKEIIHNYKDAKKSSVKGYSSKKAECMTKDQLKKLLENEKLI